MDLSKELYGNAKDFDVFIPIDGENFGYSLRVETFDIGRRNSKDLLVPFGKCIHISSFTQLKEEYNKWAKGKGMSLVEE